MEALLNNIDDRIEQPFKLSEQAIEHAWNAQQRFVEGDSKAKKEILAAVASNLKLTRRHKDKKPPVFMRPHLLRRQDDIRTSMKKAERSAALIYTHFKNELGSFGKN